MCILSIMNHFMANFWFFQELPQKVYARVGGKGGPQDRGSLSMDEPGNRPQTGMSNDHYVNPREIH